MPYKPLDITNITFHHLTAINFVEKRKLGKKHYDFWIFDCACGTRKTINKSSVVKGQTKSCGCLHKINIFKLKHGEGSFNTLMYVYKNNANKRNIVFNLSKDEFKKLTSGRCDYCGEAPEKEFKRPPSNNPFNGNYIYNGIDRVDNDMGYFVDNCVSCCETCNRAKLEMNRDDFVKWIIKVYKNIGV